MEFQHPGSAYLPQHFAWTRTLQAMIRPPLWCSSEDLLFFFPVSARKMLGYDLLSALPLFNSWMRRFFAVVFGAGALSFTSFSLDFASSLSFVPFSPFHFVPPFGARVNGP